ncbi:MAG: DUF447 family protein [Gammaproteobacteria bacterium]|nr:DUF447 family protein [Gammaproteobacteria bacterium]
MIRESIVTTRNLKGDAHIAPMGIHFEDGYLIFLPFRPSITLENLLRERCAVVNYTDDVRIFAGALTGRYDWPVCAPSQIPGWRLAQTLAHAEVEIERVEDNHVRPRLYGRVVHEHTHAPFHGFNRAQAAVVEAAILVSRLDRLPWVKIEAELAYLQIAVEKTAGPIEQTAWDWLMKRVAAYRHERGEDKHDLNAG